MNNEEINIKKLEDIISYYAEIIKILKNKINELKKELKNQIYYPLIKVDSVEKLITIANDSLDLDLRLEPYYLPKQYQLIDNKTNRRFGPYGNLEMIYGYLNGLFFGFCWGLLNKNKRLYYERINGKEFKEV